jgi:hypothetical protein
MVALVSQDEALRQLRLVEAGLTADQLADVLAKADQASAIVSDYLKVPFTEGPTPPSQQRRRSARDSDSGWWGGGWWGDWTLPPVVPPTPPDPFTPANVPTVVKAAILVVLTALYDGRTPEDILLSDPIAAILWRRRDPALA